MERWILMVESSCADPSREEEFNDWYNNVHIPDILSTPGFVAVRRYVAKEFRDGRGKYLTVCEIETDNIEQTMALRLERRKKEEGQGRSRTKAIPNLLIHSWRDVLYRQIIDRTVD